jgi:hypothetical protein
MLGHLKQLQEMKLLAVDVATEWAERNPRMSKSTGVSEILHSSRIDSINELGNFNLDAMSIDEDLDMVEFLRAQAEFDAQRPVAKVDPKRGGPVQPRDDIADAEIQAHGLAAEDAYGDATWAHDPKSSAEFSTTARNLYKQGGESRIDLKHELGGKWGTEGGIIGTWVGNDGMSTGGTTSLKMAQKFVSRFIASKDLFARKFDIAQTYSSASRANLLNAWNALNKMDGVRKYAKADKTAMSMKDIANQLGVTKLYDVSTFTERQSPTESLLMVEFTNKETGETQEANLTIEKDGDQRFATAHTGALNRNGLGGAFYQMAVEYAARNRLVIRPDDSLSGVNTYRRTEQMLASAMRSGKSNVMVPHSVQRVYGFQNDAKTQDEHDDNVVRLLLAGLRNARELAPEMGLLNYHPATDTFTLKNGKDAKGIVDRMLSNEDARAFGLGRSTLARAVLTEMALLGQLDVKSIQSISTPLLYSAREDAELEYKLVEDQYKGTPQWMKAPDGSQTQLTQRQWVQVRTPQFKEWFGDWEKAHADGGVWATKEDVSKVVGSDGEPLVVYHGTDKGGFMAFNQPGGTKRGDLGIFTTSNEGMARSYIRKGRPQGMTPPVGLGDLEEIGYAFEQGFRIDGDFYESEEEARDAAQEGDVIAPAVRAMDIDGYFIDGPRETGHFFATMDDAVEEALGLYDGATGISTIYAAFANIRHPNETNFEGALWGGERPEQYVVSIDGELQSRADGQQYFTREEAEEFAKEHPNPLYPDDDGSDYIEPAQDHYETTDDAVREGLRSGNDGTIIREVVDDGGGIGYDDTPSDVFVANKPEQLKSADWNTGEFGSSDDLRYSKKVGEFVTKLNKDGSLDVTGEPEAIRAKIPGGILGRVTTTGIRFTRLDAPRVSSALDGSSNAYSRDGVSDAKHELKAGRYVGAPKKFNTPHKIPTLRKILMSLTLEGERGRFWYERSSEEILRMVGGDVKEARKFVALLAIYSPQAKVDTNSTFALRAWSQYKAGKPISVKTKVMDLKAQEALSDVDKFWSGEKTGNFFNNLLRMIDPSTEGKQGATIDMWMMRAGQYETDAPTKTQYAFMELETNRIATELGWEPQQVQAAIWVAMKARMENAGVKKNTEQVSEKKGWLRYDWKTDEETGKPKKTRVILDEQKHRDNWLAQAFAHDPTTDDTAAAKFDFADGVLRHIGQVSWEPRPSTKLPILPGVHTADYAKQVEFQQAVQRALQDENGGDMIAMRLGLLVDGVTQAPGIWESEVSAGAQVRMAMAPALAGKALYDNQEWSSITVAEAAAIDPDWKKNPRFEMKPALDPSQVKLLDAYAAILGLLLRQDGVGYHRPFYSGNKSQENGVEINIGRALTKEEAQDVWSGVNAEMQAHGAHDWETSDSGSVALISSPNGIRVVNFGAIKDNKVFRKAIQKVANGLPEGFNGFVADDFTSIGNLVSNKWKENAHGEGYVSRISGTGSPDLLGWVRDVLAPKIQSVFNDFSARYDWGDPGEIKFSGRDQSAGRGGYRGASELDLERSTASSVATRKDQPGAGRFPDQAIRIEGAIHYGKQGGLSYLSGSSSGTGIKGAEQERLSGKDVDPRIKKRVYFYLPVAGGIAQPEIGLGGHVYQANLEGLYDINSRKIHGSSSAFESAVLDAGYIGYTNPEQGTIVVLNSDVPVKHIGSIGDHKIVQRRIERIIPTIQTRVERSELVRKPAGNEMIQIIHAQADIKSVAPSFKLQYGEARVGQVESAAADAVLAAAGSTFQFGEARYSARDLGFYSELSVQMDKATMKQAPAGAWKSFIGALAQKGVKKDEVEWTGINDFLDLQEGKVSKEQIQEYLRGNGVQVEEVVLGEDDADNATENWLDQRSQNEYGMPFYDLDSDEQDYLRGKADDANITPALPAKYSQYTLPGGENYREVLLTLPKAGAGNREEVMADLYPGKKYEDLQQAQRQQVDAYTEEESGAKQYQSSHWDQKNVLAHIRLNDRTDADGKRVLFVEEVQSDWGQDGKKRGFTKEIDRAPIEARMQEITARLREIAKSGLDDNTDLQAEWIKLSDEKSQLTDSLVRRQDTVPNAPFVTKTEGWLNLALKRIMKLGVDGGYDKVAFVNGEQSADRFSLDKRIASIKWMPSTKDNRTVLLINPIDGGQTQAVFDTKTGLFPQFESAAFGGKALDDVLGKGMAEKVMASPSGELAGEGLKLEQQGMRTFYDSIVPNATKALLKKLGGGQMEQVAIYNAKKIGSATSKTQQQPGFSITDAMREKVGNGMPLFSMRDAQALNEEQAHQDDAPATPKAKKYAGAKVDIQVKIEDTGEVATLRMDVHQTIDDFDSRQANMQKLLDCL